jgi:oligopeptide transport system substrate-binding protein
MKKWLLVLVFLIGCQSDQTSHKSPHVLRMNITREPPTMDPRKGSDWIGSSMHFLLFEGLMRLNPDGTLTPAQARTVEISDDRMTYTFHLRGAHWSDGSPVTARDFELAWKKIIDPQFGAANAHLLYPIKNAEKIKKGQLPVDALGAVSKDDLTFVVQLEKPTPYFLDLISFCLFFPVNHAIDENNPQWMMEASPLFVSNGPFKIKTWKHNSEIILEKNRRYWEEPLIDLDQVNINMIADENTALSMYENGQLDVIGMVISPLPTDALHHFYEQGLVKNQSSPATTIISFNTSKFPFTNKHIRRALSYAIDRAQIVSNITQLGEEVATNIIPECLAPTKSFFRDHDVELARKELLLGFEELRIHKFPKVTLQYSYSEVNHKLVQVLQQQWKETLGIEVGLEKFEHKILLDRLIDRTYDLATTYWFAQYKDPMSIFERFKSKNNAKNYPDWEKP